MTDADVAVVGLGPAGRALAHRLAVRGVRVLAVDPHPQRPWRQTLGGWERQLPSWLAPEAIGTRAEPVVIRSRGERALAWRYVVLETAALQASLTLDGVEVRTDTVVDPTGLAPLVVDCRGSVPVGLRVAPGAVPVQTAYGVVLDRPGFLGEAAAILMDWSPYDGRSHWGDESASFCYTVPVPGGGYLVEETCLAATPPMPVPELQRRLEVRLTRLGHPVSTLDAARVEKVRIPMLPAPNPRRQNGFGAAGGELNPVTGYSVFTALHRVDDVVDHLLLHGTVPEPPSGTTALRTTALRALTRLAPDPCVGLFDAFSRLAPAQQWAVLDPATPAPELAAALTRQWSGMPWRHRGALIRATAGWRR